MLVDQVRFGKDILGRNIFMGSDNSKKKHLYNSHKKMLNCKNEPKIYRLFYKH